jgi:hypothetical protein
LGQDRIVVPVFGRFEDPGVTATDESGVPPVISQSPLFINTNATGETVITYTATDGSGNSASVQRTVAVGDFIAPTIQLIGPSAISVERGRSLPEIDPGVLVSDNYDSPQDITILIDSADYDKDRAGTYLIAYRARDRAGNTSQQILRYITLTFGVGLANAEQGTQLRVYPNPSNGQFTVSYPKELKGANIQIMDAVGRAVDFTIATKSNVDASIRINGAAQGIYYLKITAGEEHFYQKINVLGK